MPRRRTDFLLASLMVILMPASSVRGVVIFEFDYSGSAEFRELFGGPIRRAALEDAGRVVGGLFGHDATVQMKVTSSNDPDGFTLASAASVPLDVTEDFRGFVPGVVQHKILTGMDANGLEADGDVDINFGQLWDLDDDVAFDHYDFKATMIHELLHAVGFSSLIFENGTDLYDTPPGSPGVWSPFDAYITGADGVSIIDENFALNESAWTRHSVGGASPESGLFFDGPHARAANRGQPVGLFSPSFWEDGSSGSHLDDDNPAFMGLMMLAFTDPGPYTRGLSEIEMGILKDLGYTLTPDVAEAVPVVTIERADQGVSLTVSGPEGDYVIRRSLDLQSWEVIDTVSIADPGGTSRVYLEWTGHDAEGYFTVGVE